MSLVPPLLVVVVEDEQALRARVATPSSAAALFRRIFMR
jgi:hypothetical protein